MPKIMTLGEILVEFLAETKDQSFAKAGNFIGPYPGGSPVIFIDQIGKLGSPCGIIGCVGRDDFGRLVIDHLKNDGVDANFINIVPDNTTGSAFVSRKTDGSRDFIYYLTNTASGQLDPEMVTSEALSDCDILHITGTSLFSPKLINATRKAIEIIKANGKKISFDPNLRKEMLDIPGLWGALIEIMQQADLLLPSEGELNLLLGCDDQRQSVEKAFTTGRNLKEIIVKQGKNGCQYYGRKGNSLHVPGFSVEEVDSTGAGDCFAAAYLHFHHALMDTEQALKYANAAGAYAVTKQGPMEGNTTLQELDNLITRKA